ncbi:MAG: GNAT family N-acetyltransferase [bacterium]|nr:GNAT family N-acetyltransferase [bacterium]
MKFVTGYRENEELRKSFNRLAHDTFGIDFEEWHSRGWWSDSYIPLSFEERGEIISNVSMNRVKLLINGEERRCCQIGTVMTKKERRGQGLATNLMKRAIETAKERGEDIFLFPEERELDFYRRMGFTLINDNAITLKKMPYLKGCEKRKMEIDNSDDSKMIKDFAERRIPLSDVFDSADDSAIRLWYCTYSLRDKIYRIPEANAIVSYELKDDILHLYDILSPQKIDIINIIAFLSDKTTKKVQLYFTPDLKILNSPDIEISSLNPLFYLSASPLFPSLFSFPLTARA